MNHPKDCPCVNCVAGRGPGPHNPYYEQAVSYLSKPIPYLSEDEYNDLIRRATEDAAGKSFGRLNIWQCDDAFFGKSGARGCGWFVIAIDTDPGVTPAFKNCPNPIHERQRSSAKVLGKGGMNIGVMSSKFYRLPSQYREDNASHEWIRPPYDVYRKIVHRATVEHINDGGLLFRKIGSDRYEAHELLFENPVTTEPAAVNITPPGPIG